jgi:phosphate transport system substrate-binding protein
VKVLRPGAAGMLLVAALALAACGDDNPTGAFEGDDYEVTDAGPLADPQLSGTLSASGSSAQESAQTAWIAGYRGVQPDVRLIYDAIGSGGGRENLISGASPVVGSDAYLDEEERERVTDVCGDGGALHVPVYIAPIAIPYNLPGVEQLNLSPEVLARVFSREIETWDDPAIAEVNPGADLPSTEITVVNRSDDSGTTENFLEYLHVVGGDAWPYEPDAAWPVAGGESAAQTTGVMQVTGSTVGAITYTDASAVGTLPTAAVGVGGDFVDYTPEAAAAVVDASTPVDTGVEGDLALELARDTTEEGTYPIVLVSYLIACSAYDDAQTADLVTNYLRYVISEQGQQAAADAAGSAPISQTLREAATTTIDSIQGG